MKIKYKIPIIFAIITIVSIVIYFGINFILSANMLIESEKKSYVETVANTANTITLSIEGEMEHLKAIASEDVVVGAVEYRYKNPDEPISSSEYDDVNSYLEGLVSINSYASELYIADTSGTIFAANSSIYCGTNLSNRTYFHEGMEGNTYVSEVLTSELNGDWIFVLSCPVVSDGKVMGVICKTIDLQIVFDIIDGLVLGETGYAYVVDSDGTILYHPEGAYIGTKDDNQSSEQIKDGAVVLDNDDNILKYLLALPIETLDLTIIFSKELSEILGPISIQVQSSLLAGVILLMFGSLVTAALSRRIVGPLDDLVNTVDTAKEDLSVRSDITTKDEIGVLSEEINQMLQVISEKNAEIEQLAYYSTTTGIPNRFKLERDIKTTLESDGEKTGVLISVNISALKTINESYGREIGKELLKKVTEKLQVFETEGVTLYHLGAELFTYYINKEVPRHVIEERCDIVNDHFSQKIVIGNKKISVSLVTAVTMFNHTANNAQEVLRSNDLVLHHANETNTKLVFFSESITEAFIRKAEVKEAIARGLSISEGFYLEYQPQVNLESKEIVGVEALVRYRDEKIGFVSPAEFIPIAEQDNTIVELGENIILESFRFAKEFEEKGLGSTVVAINISAAQLADSSFVSYVDKITNKYNILTNRIEFEITESMLIEFVEENESGVSSAIEILKYLRERGFRVAIDDFGTGYSSLSYLSNLPVDIIKIDKSFVDEIVTSVSSKNLVKNITKIAHDLGASVVVEGVETKEQFTVLKEIGCDVVQGYYFCKPLPGEDVQKFIKNRLQLDKFID